jgi:hypothetical protein
MTAAVTSEGEGFCRVAVAAPTTRVDLALPTGVPLVALLSSVVTHAEEDPAAPHGWALSRLDGTRLDPATALAAAGVREGELLLLHPAHDGIGEPLYDDVVEVLGEDVADTGWTPRHTRVVCAVFVALAVAALLGALGGLLALVVPTSAARAAAVVAPLALALTAVTPTLALRLSRIPRPPMPRTAADLAAVPGQLDLDQVQHRVHRARTLLTGLVVSCYIAAAVGIVVLTRDLDIAWPCVLAAILGVLLLLRARLFRRVSQVVAPLAAAAVARVAGAFAATRAWAPDAPVLLGAVAPVALVLAAAAGARGVRGIGRVDPKAARTLDTVETLLLLAVVPITFAVWDVYTALLEIRA